MIDQSSRSADIERLREALFGAELRELKALSARVNEYERIFGRDSSFTVSVSRVMADALRLSQETDHKGLASALSPVVVGAVRREITNSKEDLIQALYPVAGQLVSAYMADAVRGLLDRGDKRLRSWFSLRRAGLRLRSIVSGVPYAKLKLYHVLGIRLEQILIIKRGAGLLLDEWTDPRLVGKKRGKSDKQSLVASMIAAINEFANEALVNESGGLRTLDLGGSHVHLRATPSFILAAKCCGPASRQLERHIDVVLRQSLEAAPAVSDQLGEPGVPQGTAAGIAQKLEKLLLRTNFNSDGSVRRPVFAYVALAIMALSGFIGLGDAAVQKVKADQVRRRVADIVAATNSVVPSQIKVDIADGGGAVHLSGVVPSQAAANALTANVRNGLQDVNVSQQYLIAVPPELLTQTIAQANAAFTALNVLKTRLDIVTTNIAGILRPPLNTVTGASNALLSRAVATLRQTALPVGALSHSTEALVAKAVADLKNFDGNAEAKLKSLVKFDDRSNAPLTINLPRALTSEYERLQRLPATFTDQGWRVGLFSTSANESSVLSFIQPLSESQLQTPDSLIKAETAATARLAGTVQGEVATVNSTTIAVTTGVTSTVSDVTQNVSSLTSTATGVTTAVTSAVPNATQSVSAVTSTATGVTADVTSAAPNVAQSANSLTSTVTGVTTGVTTTVTSTSANVTQSLNSLTSVSRGAHH